ncbi:phosphoribosylformylglycinamidine cyclo-ligase [Paenibacillus glacialis]|uniref:Phosphoribosylformylglycinamidine cyclo-ligase n=1 Tax=Paenibacillus glacialis TaxID=494026 RepID=A0A168MJB5_9BACL|nr:phosphoribosylformylglycinamidine cyclo-ligase [Paenibacillus glacialis]OAB44748.1 phosphoribosylformylglycinamidine cyclo-ligase [Paenibacillus glacialis]
MNEKLSYAMVGVDIDNADATKKDMQKSLETTDSRVINKSGAFAALFEAKFEGIDNPVLVLKAEEPGSKQLLSFQHNKVGNICYDLINHLVNDIIVMGAKPEAVLDIILCGKIQKDIVVEVVEAISNACRAQDCVLIGGETSEQPKVLSEGSYMLNASILGVVDKHKIIDGSKIVVGDVVIALASNGLHTNGYTLVRTLMDRYPHILEEKVQGESFLDAILTPHRCYYQNLKELFPKDIIHGLAHITGGGIQGNLNRILPSGIDARIDLDKIKTHPIFEILKRYGNVDDEEMLKTFNMGVGITLVSSPENASQIIEHLKSTGCDACIIGEIVDGEQCVEFINNLKY